MCQLGGGSKCGAKERAEPVVAALGRVAPGGGEGVEREADLCEGGKVDMTPPRSKDPLHGITLERMLNELVPRFGWQRLGEMIPIRCFQLDPSISSSLTFLRRTPWARAKVEELYRQVVTGERA